MIQDTLAKIEAAVARIESSDAAGKKDALALLATLKEELRRGAGAAKLPRPLLEGLTRSAEGFEASHPRLAEVVGEICRELASLGI